MAPEPLFFLHFPRTAGTTVDEIFFNNHPADRILKIYSREEFRAHSHIPEEEFYKLRYITGHLLLTSVAPTQFYGKNVRAFTFLRDPVKRLHSEYLFLKTWKNQHLYEYLNANDISFSQYITSTEKILKYRGKNFMTRCISGSARETCDTAEDLERAKYNLKNTFMFFGLQERFMESLLLLADKAGLKNLLHQKRNSLNYGAVNSPLSAQEAEIAREYNKADMALYAYAQELFDARVREEGEGFGKRLEEYRFLNKKFQTISNLLYERATSAKLQDAEIELAKDVRW